MKKYLLFISVIASAYVSCAQIIVRGMSPSSVAINYQFTWADPTNSSGWSTPDFNVPATYIEDTLMLVEDGTQGTNTEGHPISQEGCNSLINNLTGKIAVVYRNTCDFSVKALNAQNAGAVGVIIINRDPESIGMASGTEGANVTVPVVMLSSTDGANLVNEMANGSVVVFIGNYPCEQLITNTIDTNVCVSFNSPSGQIYDKSGYYQEIIENTYGCDSIITNINLSVGNSQFLGSIDSIQPSFCSTPTGIIEINLIGASPINGQSVYISEYFSGSELNKSIELYNPTSQAIDIGAPTTLSSGVEATPRLINGSGQSFNLPIGTIIQPHETLIISNSDSQIPSSLYTSVVDGSTITLGYIGYAVVFPNTPPIEFTSIYDVAESIQNSSLIRKKTVVLNNTLYDSTEWDLINFPSNIVESYTLGNHHSINPNNYIVEWSTGATGNILSPILPGTYNFNIIDLQNSCIVQTESLVVPNTGNNFNPTFSSANQLYTAPPFAVQFTNSTANASNYSFTWDFGDGTTLASNNASVFHQYLFNGQYTVSLIATSNATGCTDTTTFSDYIFCTGGVSCTHTAAINQASPQQVCQGTPLWLTCNNDPSFTYQWRRNGVIISGNNNDSLQVTQSGTYSVIISVNNCPVTSNDVVVNILSAPTTPVISSNGVIQPCVGGSVTLSTGNYTSYSWSTGATSQSINVSSSGTYSVNVTGANGCSAASVPYNVNASFVASPQVCIVGMDSLTNENRIVWEKPLTLGIDSFYVYKESNVSNVYTKIGATNYNDLAVFLDVNSNPAVQAYRYKISALDTCGVESNVGDFHKTIHLTINQGVGNSWNLIWSHYEGLTFGSYNIYSGTSLSNMALLTTIQSNLNSYTDLTPPSGAVYYQIEIVNPVNCDPTKSINYGVSRSNIVNNGQGGINEETISTIQVYPNPTNDKLTLDVSNDLLGKLYFVTDFAGRIIQQGKINSLKQMIDLQTVYSGSYFLQVEQSTAKAIKIVKQ